MKVTLSFAIAKYFSLPCLEVAFSVLLSFKSFLLASEEMKLISKLVMLKQFNHLSFVICFKIHIFVCGTKCERH